MADPLQKALWCYSSLEFSVMYKGTDTWFACCNTWLLTRSCKYNLSALGTYFEGKGVKFTCLDVGSSKKPKYAAKYDLRHTWERTWPIGTGSPLKAMCSVATILMNGLINHLLKFRFHRQPNHHFAISSDTECASTNCKLAAVKF